MRDPVGTARENRQAPDEAKPVALLRRSGALFHSLPTHGSRRGLPSAAILWLEGPLQFLYALVESAGQNNFDNLKQRSKLPAPDGVVAQLVEHHNGIVVVGSFDLSSGSLFSK